MKFVSQKIIGFTNKNIKPGEYFIYDEFSHQDTIYLFKLINNLCNNTRITADCSFNILDFGPFNKLDLNNDLYIKLQKRTPSPRSGWIEVHNKVFTKIKFIKNEPDEMGLDFL